MCKRACVRSSKRRSSSEHNEGIWCVYLCVIKFTYPSLFLTEGVCLSVRSSGADGIWGGGTGGHGGSGGQSVRGSGAKGISGGWRGGSSSFVVFV